MLNLVLFHPICVYTVEYVYIWNVYPRHHIRVIAARRIHTETQIEAPNQTIKEGDTNHQQSQLGFDTVYTAQLSTGQGGAGCIGHSNAQIHS